MPNTSLAVVQPLAVLAQGMTSIMPLWSRILVFVLSGAILIVFAWGGKGHFKSEKLPLGMMVTSALSLLSFIIYAIAVFQMMKLGWVAVGLLIQATSLGLFLSAVRATRQTRISLIGDDDLPTFLVAQGPYRWVRHPFYVCYILYWAACAIIAPWFPSIIAFVVMLVLYVRSALAEEAKFRRSDIAEQYKAYQARVGFLWPKF